MIVLDARALIAFFKADDTFHQPARSILLDAADRGEALDISPMTLAEFYVGPARTGLLDRAEAGVRDAEISDIPIDRGFPRELATIRVRTGLKLPDACVLVAALTAGATGEAITVATFDGPLRRAASSYGFAVLDEGFTPPGS